MGEMVGGVVLGYVHGDACILDRSEVVEVLVILLVHDSKVSGFFNFYSITIIYLFPLFDCNFTVSQPQTYLSPPSCPQFSRIFPPTFIWHEH